MLWDGHPARSLSLAPQDFGEAQSSRRTLPALQNILGYFFNWKSHNLKSPVPCPLSPIRST